MQYAQFGYTGLTVSRLCLGCMSFDDATVNGHDRAMDLDAFRPFIRQAPEAGIDFFDTANAYSGGTDDAGRARRDAAQVGYRQSHHQRDQGETYHRRGRCARCDLVRRSDRAAGGPLPPAPGARQFAMPNTDLNLSMRDDQR